MTPTEILAAKLREPLQPAHGVWQIYGLALQALAHLIEQNDVIIQELHTITGPAESKK